MTSSSRQNKMHLLERLIYCILA